MRWSRAVSLLLGVPRFSAWTPKTVERWVTRERVPHRPHRIAAAKLLGVEETYLWPSIIDDRRTTSAGRAELVEFYPSRSLVPPDVWRTLIDQAQEHLDVLVYAGLFLPEIQDIGRIADRATAGCQVRLLLGSPHATAVRTRGDEEGFADGIAHRILLSLKYYQAILGAPGVELRLHDTTLYASIFRADDTMLVNTHVYGAPAAQNPVLHFRRIPGGRVVDHYQASFDAVWNSAIPTTDIDRLIADFNQRR